MENKTAEPKTEGDSLSIEESFSNLEAILSRLEAADLPLEESIALYQQGLTLIKSCTDRIDTVEKKIKIMNGDGTFDEF